ncbi:hypothetical protein QTO34_019229 [Cnephaeus nilssonii]|uniref:Large ribosomal subunit protein uL22 n=1 Tax=Cnephaeus nilssonii TaxID=3371016 RepID=A0AA40HWG1_CNENI|nr:hypothetical protein QTO34_019229 [Eptesicus nilssonii]
MEKPPTPQSWAPVPVAGCGPGDRETAHPRSWAPALEAAAQAKPPAHHPLRLQPAWVPMADQKEGSPDPRNAESDAELQGLDVDSLVIEHIQVNRAPRMQRRTYGAHGQMNPYTSSPGHIEMILTAKEQTVPKPEQEVAQKKKISQKKLKKEKFMAQHEVNTNKSKNGETEARAGTEIFPRSPSLPEAKLGPPLREV